MSFSELIILMVIALILFGPEDLPDVARTVGRIVFEVKKIAGDMTREFQNAVDTPSNVLEKAFDQTVNKTSPKAENKVEKEDSSDFPEKSVLETPASKVDDQEELLTYEEEDPLAELPQEMVSYEKKGASR